MYTYLLINVFTILIPLLLSFERRIRYVNKWRCLLPSVAIVGIIFLIWDRYFILKGVWGFNPSYLVGVYFFHVPLEEILFFICIPFSCVFIYEVVRYFIKRDILNSYLRLLILSVAALLGAVGILARDKMYTSITFLSCAVLLLLHLYYLKSSYLGHFLLTYSVSMIPFLIVNGILTNGLSYVDNGAVVWYNNAENLSIRIAGIPIEDGIYSGLLLLLNITVYEYFKKKACRFAAI